MAESPNIPLPVIASNAQQSIILDFLDRHGALRLAMTAVADSWN
jgi:hypothetical protein